MTTSSVSDSQPRSVESTPPSAASARADPFGFARFSRTGAWVEVVGLLLFAYFWDQVRMRWMAAGMSTHGVSIDAFLMPEICTALIVAVQAGFLTMLRRRGLRALGPRALGLSRVHAARQAAWGIVMGAAMCVTMYATYAAIGYAVGLPENASAATWVTQAPRAKLILLLLATGVATETLYRGLILPRLHHATGSAIAAVTLSVLPQALFYYWGNYGWHEIVNIAGVNLVMGSLYLRVRSLPAAILGDFIYGFVAFVIVPGLGN